MGAIPEDTARGIAARNGIALPRQDAGSLYAFGDFYEFLDVYNGIAGALRSYADFAEAAYASLKDGHRHGNLRYREMSFNPTDHTKAGVPYEVAITGLVEGIRAAEADFGVRCRLIAAINRMEPVTVANEMLADVLRWRQDEVIGIGMDYAERSGPPGRFAETFQAAERAGLHRTAHACEDNQTLEEAPPGNVVTCLDLLKCERIDHGYNVLADPWVTARCRDDGVPFTCCPTTSNKARIARRRRSIAEMSAAGLNVSLHTDDPAMFRTSPGDAYVAYASAAGIDSDEAVRLCLNSVDAAWLDPDEARAMRTAFKTEIEQYQSRPDIPA